MPRIYDHLRAKHNRLATCDLRLATNTNNMKKILLAILMLIGLTAALAGASILINNQNLLSTVLYADGSGKVAVPETTSSFTYDEYIAKGELLIENGYNSLAINEYTQAANIEPSLAQPYVLIGEAHILEGNHEKALANFEKALEKDPDNVDAVIGVAQSYLHLKEFDLARSTLDSANHPDEPKFKFYQAMLYAYDREYERSQRYLEDSIEIEGAQELLDAYLQYESEQGGQETHLRTLLAQACTEIDQYELATSILYQVLSEIPTYRDAWILLGYSYLEMGEYDNSASAFEEAIELDTTKPESNYFLALAYFGQEKYTEAINYLELAQVYGFEPEVQIYQKLAEIYFLLDDIESATKNYEKILQLNDSEVSSFIRPIWLNMEYLDNVAKSIELAQWALSVHPEDAMSYNLMGWTFLEDGQIVEAENYLIKALEINPELAAAYLNLGTLYESQGELEKAQQHYKKAYNLEPESSVGKLAAEKYNSFVVTEE